MLAQWLHEAKQNQPLWLPDMQKTCAEREDASPLLLRLELWDGTKRDWRLNLPRWHSSEEEQLAAEYLQATVFNILTACSGRKLTVYHDPADIPCTSLVQKLPSIFQVLSSRRTGYGKVITLANRLGASLGKGSFSFDFLPWQEYTPLPSPLTPSGSSLGELLRKAARQAEKGLCCGVDVGGTDVKLSLAQNGRIILTQVWNWCPSRSPDAEGIVRPLLEMIQQAVASAAPDSLLDSLGMCFPDVVIKDRIIGGETPKTQGMRNNPYLDYESNFRVLRDLKDLLTPLCRPHAPVHLINDGVMAAFTAAMEIAHSGDDRSISPGVVAHSLGTDLGTGYLDGSGKIPEIPLELYDCFLDLGCWQSRTYPPADLRSVRNENSGLADARRYLGQSAAFRLAWVHQPDLIADFVDREGANLFIRREPDLRKPCLEHLMEEAKSGNPNACRIFWEIGFHLGKLSEEMIWLLHPAVNTRFLFGRFAKQPACFQQIHAGFTQSAPTLQLTAADSSMAYTPLMCDLARRDPGNIAAYAQSIGAVYFPFVAELQQE